MFVWRTGSSWGGRVDGYCDRLTPVSIWSLRSLRKKSSAIIRKPLSSDRSDNDRWDRTFYISAIVVPAIVTIAGEWFHMIAMIAAIAEVFFFFLSAIAAITVMGAIMWKPGFNLIMAYFKRKNCLQRNLYLNCVSLWKSLNIVWSVSISAVIWSSLLISVTWVELLWAVYKFFRINNIVPKISQVMMKRRPEVHISIDLQLCRFTLWHNGRRNFWKMNVLKDSANTDR